MSAPVISRTFFEAQLRQPASDFCFMINCCVWVMVVILSATPPLR